MERRPAPTVPVCRDDALDALAGAPGLGVGADAGGDIFAPKPGHCGANGALHAAKLLVGEAVLVAPESEQAVDVGRRAGHGRNAVQHRHATASDVAQLAVDAKEAPSLIVGNG